MTERGDIALARPWRAEPESLDSTGKPWPGCSWLVKDANGRLVACLVTESDARLIASAPRMRRALDLVSEWAHDNGDAETFSDGSVKTNDAMHVAGLLEEAGV
jgi:hypothetical protein